MKIVKDAVPHCFSKRCSRYIHTVSQYLVTVSRDTASGEWLNFIVSAFFEKESERLHPKNVWKKKTTWIESQSANHLNQAQKYNQKQQILRKDTNNSLPPWLLRLRSPLSGCPTRQCGRIRGQGLFLYVNRISWGSLQHRFASDGVAQILPGSIISGEFLSHRRSLGADQIYGGLLLYRWSPPCCGRVCGDWNCGSGHCFLGLGIWILKGKWLCTESGNGFGEKSEGGEDLGILLRKRIL